MSDKKDLREKLFKNREILFKKDDGMAARYVASQIIMLPELDTFKIISGYYTMKGELDCLVILKALNAAFYKIALPSLVKKDHPLDFHEWDLKTDLIKGPFGTKEVEEKEKSIIPEVLIVPLLGFDLEGYRLGYGGGYYDRTIELLKKNNPKLVTIGVAYDGQKIDVLPRENHDQKLSMVVTEKKTYRFN